MKPRPFEPITDAELVGHQIETNFFKIGVRPFPLTHYLPRMKTLRAPGTYHFSIFQRIGNEYPGEMIPYVTASKRKPLPGAPRRRFWPRSTLGTGVTVISVAGPTPTRSRGGGRNSSPTWSEVKNVPGRPVEEQEFLFRTARPGPSLLTSALPTPPRSPPTIV